MQFHICELVNYEVEIVLVGVDELLEGVEGFV
jgi:hypothetical protein